MSIVFMKVVLSVILLAVVGGVLWKKEYLTVLLKQKNVTLWLAIGWVIFRFLPFLAIYLVAGYAPTSDVNGFWDEASKAAEGQVVYRDFWSPYSPLYAYYLGTWLNVWYDPRMIVLLMTIMDALALYTSWYLYRAQMADFLYKSLLYYLLPGSIILCVVGAQEDVWMWFFVLVAYLLRQRTGRVEVYAFVLALGLLLTKAIFVLILIPLFLIEKQKLRFVLLLSSVGVITLAILYPLVGWEFMQPMDEAKVLRAPNILSVLNPWFVDSIGVGEKFWNWVGLVLSLGLGSLTAWRFRNAGFVDMISRTWVALYATMMVVQQSAYSNYIFLFLIPVVFYVIDWHNKREVGLLLLYNLLCVIHPSYWWRQGMPKYLTPSDIWASTSTVVDYLMQLGIVLLTGYFIRIATTDKRLL